MASGHRAVPHTADVRIEAWAPSREECIAEAVLGLVEGFADISGVRPTGTESVQVSDASDDDLLVAVLDEVIYRLEVAGDVPVDVEVEAMNGGLDVRLAVVDLDAVPITGAAPKAVSLYELHLSPGPRGWTCSVTVDV
jgi:SHS2 domain-containing protein